MEIHKLRIYPCYRIYNYLSKVEKELLLHVLLLICFICFVFLFVFFGLFPEMFQFFYIVKPSSAFLSSTFSMIPDSCLFRFVVMVAVNLINSFSYYFLEIQFRFETSWAALTKPKKGDC
jgi:hypothetical protein